jgi:hypothetical protein
MSSTKTSRPFLPSSESNSGAQIANTSDGIIADLTALLRIGTGRDPVTVLRLRRTVADGGDDIIEVPVYRPNLTLALTILRTRAGLAARSGEPRTAANELDPKEAEKLTALLRKYEDGSHPSHRIGIKTELVRDVDKA